MDERLKRQQRIRKNKDFLDLYRKGSRYRGRYFHLVYDDSPMAFPRLAVVVSKKVGTAVARNKIKRRIRALFRRNKPLFVLPMDVILVAKKEIVDLSWAKLSAEFFAALDWIMRRRSVR